MKKVKKLASGSRIAVISPSNGVPHMFPDVYELGLKNLKDALDFEIVEFPTARMSTEELYNNPKLRAEDINRAFGDESIDGIIASIGGYESVRILKYLDRDVILNNPKLIMGFSDATAYLAYINKLGLVTFYGPSVMAGFAQFKNLPLESQEHIKNFLTGNIMPYEYPSYSKWTNGYKDWGNREVLGECTDFMDNSGWNFIQKGSRVQGKLWGGCIEVLEFLKGTEYWPEREFWDDKILFFETSEEKPLPNNVGYMLRNYGIQGILERIRGIMFGRPKDYTGKERQELYNVVMNILEKEFHVTDIPVVMNVDFGHTDPKIILPLGCMVEIDPDSKGITLLENPFQ